MSFVDFNEEDDDKFFVKFFSGISLCDSIKCGKLSRAFDPRYLKAARSYAMAAASGVSYVPSHNLDPLFFWVPHLSSVLSPWSSSYPSVTPA